MRKARKCLKLSPKGFHPVSSQAAMEAAQKQTPKEENQKSQTSKTGKHVSFGGSSVKVFNHTDPICHPKLGFIFPLKDEDHDGSDSSSSSKSTPTTPTTPTMVLTYTAAAGMISSSQQHTHHIIDHNSSSPVCSPCSPNYDADVECSDSDIEAGPMGAPSIHYDTKF
ncbi:hypothetical protein OCHUTO_0005 [Orientia chuto str. Dubai]|uniref:Uncharacterized protein n=1 Tax=Orientia chuto str. Dubai TaxID=1359168 RepID=A0A0F3MPC7_9RICK|nr:hypothetical protein [Candidatus Orientia mediorientalis]KJV57526.1 hypothetical protein OCHUTO_0005 [Orientia chuto str. Dubai]